MTLKVGHGQKSGPDVARNNAPRQTHHGKPDHSETRRDRTNAHDNTPNRQRELETHGHNLRARVEGQSHKHGDKRHSHQTRSSQHSEHSERGVGVRINGDTMGVEIEARVGLNRSNRSDRSHHFRGDSEGRVEGHGNHERHSRGHSRSHDQAGRTGNNHHSTELHTGFQRGSEHRSSRHSGEGSNRANHHHGRDTIGTLRDELRAFRTDSRDGPAHRTIGLTDRHIDRVLHLATKGLEDRFSHGEHSERIGRRVIADASGVSRVVEHFSRLESAGGEPVRRAYEAVMNFLLHDREPERLWLTTELLRDLSSGAFLHPRDMEGPFPLTGRARLVSEMMELMRTLEAIEKFANEMRANPNRNFNGDLFAASASRLPGGIIGSDLVDLVAHALANSGPTFPGLAGRLEIPRLIAALEGILTDAAGRPLIIVDGSPLKLGELLWFNARPDAAIDLWALDRFPTRLSPLLIHGFDAVYSLIGFDGRPLSLPRFMAIQSQINASEFEWLFGQAPLSEGWVRSAIEFLKDSISFDHNVLGELLEEGVTTGRFHLTVMSGAVEDGKAVSGSFSFAPVQSLSPALSPLGR